MGIPGNAPLGATGGYNDLEMSQPRKKRKVSPARCEVIDLTEATPPKKKAGAAPNRSYTDSYAPASSTYQGGTQGDDAPPKRRKKVGILDDPTKARIAGDAAEALLPKKKKAKREPDEEKRLRRWRKAAPGSYLEIRQRALTQRMFALDRQRDMSNPDHPVEVIKLAGTTGNVYEIRVDKVPSCSCPHATKGAAQCKHIAYCLSRVLRVRPELEYQLAFISSELREIFAAAPPLPSETADESAKDGNRKEVEGECPICYSDFEPMSKESIVYCKASCGNNIHKECMKQWAASNRGGAVTCPLCRSPWQADEGENLQALASGGTVNAEGYVNLASQLGLSGRRDYSTYHSHWVRNEARRGNIAWDEDGVMNHDMDQDHHDGIEKSIDQATLLPLHESSIPTESNAVSGQAVPARSASASSTEFLTGLRGLAAFLVYFYHHVSWFYGAFDDLLYGYGQPKGIKYFGQLPFVRVFFTGGNPAVAIFFVLSGYVLSVSPLRSIRNGDYQKTYRSLISAAIRRPFRLYMPPIGVSIVVLLTLHLPAFIKPTIVWPPAEASLWLELKRWVGDCIWLVNPFVYHGVSGRWFVYNPPSYTMPIELLGSWVLFAALAISTQIPSRYRMATFCATGVALLLFHQWFLACFMAGIVLAMADQTYRDTPMVNPTASQRLLHYSSFFAGWYLLSGPGGVKEVQVSLDTPGFGYLTSMIPSYYYNGEYWRWWHTWGALLLVYGVLRIQPLQRFFASSSLQYLGKISFLLYLIHMPLLWTFSDRMYRLVGTINQTDLQTWWDGRLTVPDWGVHGLTTRFLVAQAVITPVNILLAHVCTSLLDDPSIRIGRWVVQRLGI
ncbi:hypothetical protein B0A48_02499 [Cryoendolithus antarcticus]|uniref:RING-type domain-containing protein n=1 Tax=Cryoendolithus antarcticus TaxID=1507870 RepID=A0A1V8TNU2_9PEZI|nr:hypothetical protein B0A48_02499 [Cryoendolithus antarcticus]